MRCPGVDLQRSILDKFRCQVHRSPDRYYLVIIAVNNQRRHIDFLEPTRTASFRESPWWVACWAFIHPSFKAMRAAMTIGSHTPAKGGA